MPFTKELAESWRDTCTVRRVFGDPVEKDGLTVVPVAMVVGCGCGGGGAPADEAGDGAGDGGGFGGIARPAGVYVVRADSVEWHPALDVTLLGMAGIVLSALIALVVGWAIGRRR